MRSVSDVAPAGADASIPDRALLRPGDLETGIVRVLAADPWQFLRPPQPGGAAAYPSTERREAARSVGGIHCAGGLPTVIVHCAVRYSGAGSQQYLTELREVLSAGICEPSGRLWWLAVARPAGPDSLLAEVQRSVTDNGGDIATHITYLAVARVGHLVVTVADVGWEGGSGSAEAVRELLPVAMGRAATVT